MGGFTFGHFLRKLKPDLWYVFICKDTYLLSPAISPPAASSTITSFGGKLVVRHFTVRNVVSPNLFADYQDAKCRVLQYLPTACSLSDQATCGEMTFGDRSFGESIFGDVTFGEMIFCDNRLYLFPIRAFHQVIIRLLNK